MTAVLHMILALPRNARPHRCYAYAEQVDCERRRAEIQSPRRANGGTDQSHVMRCPSRRGGRRTIAAARRRARHVNLEPRRAKTRQSPPGRRQRDRSTVSSELD